jgi:hypothetical protein
MPDPRAFISFDFDSNRTEKGLFAGQGKSSKTPCQNGFQGIGIY